MSPLCRVWKWSGATQLYTMGWCYKPRLDLSKFFQCVWDLHNQYSAAIMVISAIVHDRKWKVLPSSEQADINGLCVFPSFTLMLYNDTLDLNELKLSVGREQLIGLQYSEFLKVFLWEQTFRDSFHSTLSPKLKNGIRPVLEPTMCLWPFGHIGEHRTQINIKLWLFLIPFWEI